MKVHHVILSVVLVAAVVIALYLGRSNSETGDAVLERHDEETVSESPLNPHSQSPIPKKVSIREQVAKVVEKEVRPLKDVANVEHYLAQLKKRAHEKQRVTALELHPGIEAIRALEPMIGPEETERRIHAFSKEMSTLSKAFGRVPESAAPLTPAEAADILEEIEYEADPAIKQQAIREYLDRAKLAEDPEEHIVLMERLDSVIDRNRTTPETPDFDATAEAIQNAADNATKQDAIRKYLDAARHLNPEEQMRAMERLSQLKSTIR